MRKRRCLSRRGDELRAEVDPLTDYLQGGAWTVAQPLVGDSADPRLTPLEKSVYHQYYEEDNSAADTADTLGIKRNTVNDAARRIRKKAAGLLFVTLLLCVQGGTFLIL